MTLEATLERIAVALETIAGAQNIAAPAAAPEPATATEPAKPAPVEPPKPRGRPKKDAAKEPAKPTPPPEPTVDPETLPPTTTPPATFEEALKVAGVKVEVREAAPAAKDALDDFLSGKPEAEPVAKALTIEDVRAELIAYAGTFEVGGRDKAAELLRTTTGATSLPALNEMPDKFAAVIAAVKKAMGK